MGTTPCWDNTYSILDVLFLILAEIELKCHYVFSSHTKVPNWFSTFTDRIQTSKDDVFSPFSTTVSHLTEHIVAYSGECHVESNVLQSVILTNTYTEKRHFENHVFWHYISVPVNSLSNIMLWQSLTMCLRWPFHHGDDIPHKLLITHVHLILPCYFPSLQ